MDKQLKQLKHDAEKQLTGQKTEEERQAVLMGRKLTNATKALQKIRTQLKKLDVQSEEYLRTNEEEIASSLKVEELTEQYNRLRGLPPKETREVEPEQRNGHDVEVENRKKNNEKDSKERHSHTSRSFPATTSTTPPSTGVSKEKNTALTVSGAKTEQTEEKEEVFVPCKTRTSAATPSAPFGDRKRSHCSPIDRALYYLSTGPIFIHPQVAEATLLMEELVIIGSNARTMTMIAAFKQLLRSIMKCGKSSSTNSTVGGGGGSGGSGGSGGRSGGEDWMLDRNTVRELLDANFHYMCRKRKATSGMLYVHQTLKKRATLAGQNSVPHDFSASVSSPTGRPEVHAGNSDSKKGMAPSSSPPTATQSMPASNSSDSDNERTLLNILERIEQEIYASRTNIVLEKGHKFISSDETILVFGRSSVVEDVLLHAALTKVFKVIIIDAAPLYEGRKLMLQLSSANISVTYALLTSCCTLMPRATRVFIGAASVLQNGDVFSRCGTAVVAACAKSFRRPVLCFSESYKFIPEVWLGNIGQNDVVFTTDISPSSTYSEEVAATGGGDGGATGERGRGRRVVLVGAEDGGNKASNSYWNLNDATDPFFHANTVSSPRLLSVSATRPVGGTGGPSPTMPSFSSSGYMKMFPARPSIKGSLGVSGGNTLFPSAPSASPSFIEPLSGTVSYGYLYDLTPTSYVDLIISEIDCLHTSAIVEAIKDREMRDTFW